MKYNGKVTLRTAPMPTAESEDLQTTVLRDPSMKIVCSAVNGSISGP